MNEKIEKIISLIFITRRVLHEQLKNQTGKNFSFLQIATLRQIREKKPLMKELSDFLAITPPSATSLVNILVKAKLIKRIADADDRRIVRIEITKNGEIQLKKCQERMTKNMQERLEKLTDKEQKDLIKILTKITEI